MSGEKPRWVKRKRQISRVESMLAAKAQKSSPAVALEGPSQLEDQSNSEEQAMSMSADESFILPRVHSSDEESNTDTESEFTESDAKIAYHFRRVREYHRAYREGKSGGAEVEEAVKLYKSHRRVSETESV